jgi:hypothetical protein
MARACFLSDFVGFVPAFIPRREVAAPQRDDVGFHTVAKLAMASSPSLSALPFADSSS